MRRSRPFDGAGELLVSMPDDWIELSVLKEKLGWSWQTFYNRLRVLEQYRLIESRYEEKPPGRRFIRPSEKGRRAKRLLEELYALLES